MHKQKTSCYTIYNQRLAGYLMLNGYPLRYLIKKADRNQFLFDNTEEIQKIITAWKSKN